jgi:N utilization substance protein B
MSRKSGKSPAARSAARLAAVQALYDADITGSAADRLIQDFVDQKVGGVALVNNEDDSESEVALAEADSLLLAALVRETLARREALDEMIAGALTGDWHQERLEAVLRAILRVGACELAAMPNTPVRVVISEYVDVASAFYGGAEPGMVNAVLDRVARVVRSAEFGGNGAA